MTLLSPPVSATQPLKTTLAEMNLHDLSLIGRVFTTYFRGSTRSPRPEFSCQRQRGQIINAHSCPTTRKITLRIANVQMAYMRAGMTAGYFYMQDQDIQLHSLEEISD